MRNKIIFACFVLTFGARLLWAQSGEPSLADVAKHKPKKHAAKVVTEDDIPGSVSFDGGSISPDSNTQPGEDNVGRGDQRKDSNSQSDAKPASASDDSARLQDLKNQEARQTQVMQQIKKEMEEETDDFRRGVRRQMVEDMQIKLDNTAKERQQLEQKMADKKSEEKPTQPKSDENPK